MSIHFNFWFIMAPLLAVAVLVFGYLNVYFAEGGVVRQRVSDKILGTICIGAAVVVFLMMEYESQDWAFAYLDHGNQYRYSPLAEMLAPWAIALVALAYAIFLREASFKLQGWHRAMLEWQIAQVEFRLRKEFDKAYGDTIEHQNAELALYKEGPNQETLKVLQGLKVLDLNNA